MKPRSKKSRIAGDRYLDGQLLLAMPGMADKRFRRSVIYMCSHSDDGAMGIIINQHAKKPSFVSLMQQLDLIAGDDVESLPDDIRAQSIHIGGPVSTERGFVLHSNDVSIDESTMAISDGICLTATLDILKIIAKGKGPRRSLLALGYAGWSAGQLETEMQANGWLHCPADADLVFSQDIDQTYERALSKLGVDLSFLSVAAGHA